MSLFTADFFAHNRKRLYAQLPSDAALVLAANGAMQRNTDLAFQFEQEPNFWYLTGIDMADWRLIAHPASGDEWLVAPDLLSSQKLFDGSLSAEAAIQLSGISTILTKREGAARLRSLSGHGQTVHTLLPQPRRMYGFYTNRAQHDLAGQLKPATLADVRPTLARLRAIKQPLELQALEQAVDISVAGIKAMLYKLPTYTAEYEVEARLSYEFRRRNASGHAYDPIVASGLNACTLHYSTNDARWAPNDWLLFDTAARYDHYNADITRTVPLGRATNRQRAIYAACLRVHDSAIELCRPAQSVREYLERTDSAMSEELVRLGLIKEGDIKAMRRYAPHAISHGLGIDVHDSLGRPEVFAENMVLTVEPGIYLPEERFGMRIEDDVLITADGPRVLSSELSTDIDELV